MAGNKGLDSIKDEKLKKAVIEELKRQERRRKVIITFCIVAAIGCFGYFFFYQYMAERTEITTTNWAEQIRSGAGKGATVDPDAPVIVHKTGEKEAPPVLEKFVSILKENKSVIGWLSIPGTDIDYPVMQTQNNDYYLVGLVCGSKNETPENLLEDIYKLINDKDRGARFLDTFRVDKIRELDKLSDKEVEKRLSETDNKLIKKISMSTFKKSWSNIQDYVSQNSSLYPGRNLTAKIKLYDKSDEVLSEAIDCFGKENVRIEKVSDENQKEGYLLTVDTNDNAVIEFTKTYASCVEVVEPAYLREEILEIFKAAYERMIEK